MEDKADRQKQLAVRIAATATDEEKEALKLWIDQLLALKESDLPAIRKAKEALLITANSKIIVPRLKMIGRESKRLAWDERSVKQRLGIGGVAAGLAFFGSQGAGIAALGTAIGVPLWVVFGAGGLFLGELYEQITGKPRTPKTTHTVIDSKWKD